MIPPRRGVLFHVRSPIFFSTVLGHLLFCLAASVSAECQSPEDPGLPAPQPVDPSSDEWEEQDGSERKDWIDALHGSAPGVDWRAVERARERSDRERLGAADGHLALGQWVEIGSRNQSGQTRCAALAPDGSLLLGSATVSYTHLTLPTIYSV